MSEPSVFEPIWHVLDGQVASGRIPGYVAAVRIRDEMAIHTGGQMAVDAGSPAMSEDTLFRIASMTKPIGGALTLSLVKDGFLALDDPIATWLPEAAHPRVLTSPEAPLDSTVEAQRPITVRHLLTMGCGWGVVLTDTPQWRAMVERKVTPGPLIPPLSADEFVARVAEVPLAFQPGEGWLYDTGMDLLGVLLARATGKALSHLVAERIT
ncbi:MAG: beta-lactamase family protein, partial [Acidimicrobiaceae bacterium]|nr:beta-lactamase family protein [Acidimicrobiaceae bacterium]